LPRRDNGRRSLGVARIAAGAGIACLKESRGFGLIVAGVLSLLALFLGRFALFLLGVRWLGRAVIALVNGVLVPIIVGFFSASCFSANRTCSALSRSRARNRFSAISTQFSATDRGTKNVSEKISARGRLSLATVSRIESRQLRKRPSASASC
jgi:hypothetical protein